MNFIFRVFTVSALLMSGFISSTNAYAQTESPIEKIISEQQAEAYAKGGAIYAKHCMACHAASNIMVASPKFGNRTDWGTRLAENKSLKGLSKSATKGKGAMPAKGLCLDCKSKDLEAAIVYMMRGQE